MQRQNGTDRRQFMIRAAGAASGAWLALELPVAEAIERQDAGLPLPPTAWRSSAWLTMQPDGLILVTVHKAEMGQGVLTALPMLIAEELALPMSRVAAVLAPAADEFRDERGNQSTGYSSSIRTSYLPFRTLGATARELLLVAAAHEWQADPTRLRVQDGYVVDPANSARRVPFSALLETARTLAVPVKPTLKDSLQFRLLGTRPTRLDTPSKIDGSAVFGIDFKLPGMKVAVLERTPTFDGVLSDVDDAAALAIPGVVSVRVLPVGVAVIADSFWAAQRGRAALKIDWDPGANEAQNSAQHERELTGPMPDQGHPARVRGDVDRLRRDPENRWLVADYFAPFLAHAALEPIATTVWFHDGLCEIWVGTQAPLRAQDAAMKVTGLPRERVKVNCLQIGGSFGRRGERDYITEAVTVARSMPATPIKLMWSREDDMRADFYRPASAHRVAGCVNPQGELVGLAHRVVAPSVARRRAPEMLTTAHDFLLTQGSDDSLYDIPHLRVDYHELDLGVPVGFWRSVGHSYNVFVIESFIDEVAALAKRDPVDLRLELLRNDPRMLRVLRAAAAAAGWGRKLGAGMGLGIACSKSYETRVAVVAEINVEGASWRATRLWCAVDCGSVVHPGQVEQQIQGGLVFGLTAAMYGEITFDKGAVKQANFDAYPLLAMSAMPRIAVQLMASDESPTGVGEPATPVIAPAVANALFATSGQRLRRMPLKLKEPPRETAKSPSTLRRPVTDR
ncbi:MAG: xanthine dehydrogenase family protein molybdopterin-binding subunit [Gammaproteobacteria bacterium]|nr:xanthine dehydrogenase family protein molybdopterin-binding subunit [Gammaproteobacteria bacterium]